ncbi:hypothetical protein [Pseudomonas sp. W15Feb34]|uniref:hypothetical protein n=1 Tax=Pseudomonas sp. W15Feb34 TaxID=550727 RepID=UPI002005CF2A|nr:hypothetical protein [Pseudomonas sp. W15Feb34]MCK3846955.1 hypothetical protein [Pseudomonas sp. W15Feb34]
MDVFYRDYLAGIDHPVDDEVLYQALESLEGAALKFSADAISDAKQRGNYNRNAKRVKDEVLAQVKAGNISIKEAVEFCYEARNKIMAEIRAKTSVQGKAVVEAKKAAPPSLDSLLNKKSVKRFGRDFAELNPGERNVAYYEVIESSARADAKFNTTNKVLRVSGKVLIVVTIVYAAYDIAHADNKPKEAFKQGAVISGGIVGTFLGSAAAGSLCGPGAPVCTIGLMLGAGIAAGWAALEATEYYDDEIEEFTKWGVN